MIDKKILYLRTDILPEKIIAGGSISHTIGVLQGFGQLGYTTICASAILKHYLKTIASEKLYVIRNPKVLQQLPSKINNILSNFFFTRQVIKAVQHENISYIYQRYSLLNATGVIVKKIKQIPLILEYNGSEVWVDKHWSAKRFIHLRTLIRFFEWVNLTYADYIVVVSQALCDNLAQRGIDTKKILVNPNGVDTDLYDPEKLKNHRTRIRQKLNIENKFVFGFVGTFAPWHGIEILNDIIPQVIQQNSAIHFLLIGDGPLKRNLKTFLQKKNLAHCVTFTGLICNKQARYYLAACDAFLSPTQPNSDGSRFFGSPTKLFEYLSMGRPIIASNLEQIKEIISPSFDTNNSVDIHHQVGMLVEPKNREIWVKALCFITNLSKENLENIGKNARKKAIHCHQWKSHVQNIITFVSSK